MGRNFISMSMCFSDSMESIRKYPPIQLNLDFLHKPNHFFESIAPSSWCIWPIKSRGGGRTLSNNAFILYLIPLSNLPPCNPSWSPLDDPDHGPPQYSDHLVGSSRIWTRRIIVPELWTDPPERTQPGSRMGKQILSEFDALRLRWWRLLAVVLGYLFGSKRTAPCPGPPIWNALFRLTGSFALS